MARAAALPETWELTSDSLAAWLAGALGADRLVLVKHGRFDAAAISARTSSHAASLIRYSHAILRRAALALGSRRQPTAGDSPKGCSAPYFLKSCERT